MKFVEEHFTAHHLFHAPHRWFFALLLSPIHAAEMHYLRRYHLTYSHAKTLFVFDLSLLTAIVVLTGGIIFWNAYDPTVEKDVGISLGFASHDGLVGAGKIRAGEHVEITANYRNASASTLLDAAIAMELPDAFVLESGAPAELFSSSTSAFHLPPLPPGARGAVTVRGFFYGTPNDTPRLRAVLSYRQEHRAAREQKIAALHTALRGSVVSVSIDAPDRVPDTGRMRAAVTIKNNNHHAISEITLPFAEHPHLRPLSTLVTTGTSTKEAWTLPVLLPGETASAEVVFATSIPRSDQEVELRMTPVVSLHGISLSQESAKKTMRVVHPNLSATAAWKNSRTVIAPGEAAELLVALANNGMYELRNMELGIASDAIAPRGRIRVASLLPQEQRTIAIPVTLSDAFLAHAVNPEIRLSPSISARVDGMPDIEYETTAGAHPLVVATSIRLSPRARYYTEEGDQLGRGPLPPQVGKETKYWIAIPIQNGTNRADGVVVRAELAEGISWTGRYSMNTGMPIVWSDAEREVTWRITSLLPHESAVLNMEVSLTPRSEDRGAIPLLLSSVRAEATDAFAKTSVSAAAPPLSATLTGDPIGQKKGVHIR